MSCILPLRTWPGSKCASISMLWMYIRRSRYVRLLGVGWPWWSAQALRGEPAKAEPTPAARCKNSRLVEAGDLRAWDEATSEAPVFLGKEDLFIGVSDSLALIPRERLDRCTTVPQMVSRIILLPNSRCMKARVRIANAVIRMVAWSNNST